MIVTVTVGLNKVDLWCELAENGTCDIRLSYGCGWTIEVSQIHGTTRGKVMVYCVSCNRRELESIFEYSDFMKSGCVPATVYRYVRDNI